jgi:multidrug transporter EmrE-like cation transporter
MRTTLFLACYCAAVTAANVLLKLSAEGAGLWVFLAFQAAGNLAGLAGILLYTWLMRSMPLHVAFPLSRGAGVLGVQLVGSILIFREAFTVKEAVGVVMVAVGIILVGLASPGGHAFDRSALKASGVQDRGA